MAEKRNAALKKDAALKALNAVKPENAVKVIPRPAKCNLLAEKIVSLPVGGLFYWPVSKNYSL
jgi:hypothetical protein